MKQTTKLIVTVFAFSLLGYISCFSQRNGQVQNPFIPIDSCVRTGKMNNGLTFYIRHNDTQPHQASFYLVQKVGSILEDDNQRGLAHFLEHMCFEGTYLFPGQTIANYLQSKGVKFGFDLNAATEYDKTIYNIEDVPLSGQQVVDSCIYILSQWAHALTLDSIAIEKERKVIHEEWRSRMSAEQRMMDKAAPELFPNCKYAYRSPIGTMEIIDHFPKKQLVDFYNKWYRPDLQAVIIVGDVDVKYVERRLINAFRHNYLNPNRTTRTYENVGDNIDGKPVISIQKDPEETNPRFNLMFKRSIYDFGEKAKEGYYALKHVERMIKILCEQRFERYAGAKSPIISTSVSDGDYLGCFTKKALSIDAIYRKGGFDNAMTYLLFEATRIYKYGFTKKEYERAKNELVASLEYYHNNRQNITNNEYIQDYVNHFLENEPIPNFEYEYKATKTFIEEITIPAINFYVKEMLNFKNLVIYCTSPDKKGYTLPTVKGIMGDLKFVNDMNIYPLLENDDEGNDKHVIMKKKPKAGNIATETENVKYGTIEMTLSNGAKVIIKKNDTKQDELKMLAVANGGLSQFPNSYVPTLQAMKRYTDNVGFGSHYVGEMSELTNGMTVHVEPGINDTRSSMEGNCSLKDMEAMFQLTYLRFSKPMFSWQSVYAMQNIFREYLRNQGAKPENIFRDSLMNIVFDYNPRTLALTRKTISNVSLNGVKDIYHGCFDNISKYTFVFSGNADVNKIRALIKLYIASLPSVKEENPDTIDIVPHKGIKRVDFKQNMLVKKGMVGIYQSGTCSYSMKNDLMVDMAAQIMETRLINAIREKEGATYSVSLNGGIVHIPSSRFNFTCIFNVNPEKIDSSVKYVEEELNSWMQKAPTLEEINWVKEFKKKRYEQNVKLNDYWLYTLGTLSLDQVDRYTDYCKIVDSITPEELQQFIGGLIKQNNRVTVTMKPE